MGVAICALQIGMMGVIASLTQLQLMDACPIAFGSKLQVHKTPEPRKNTKNKLGFLKDVVEVSHQC